MQKFLIFFSLSFLVIACKNESKETQKAYISFEGKTMGTYYKITYDDSLGRNLQEEVERLLIEINDEVSTYIPTSTISQFNQSEMGIDVNGKAHFLGNFLKAREVCAQSGGAFDPTVMPLVNYWGFGYTEKKPVTQVDSMKIDSLIAFVGMDKVSLDEGFLKKIKPSVQLDFSGIATGYAIDTLGGLLEAKGIKNYLVDIGGEQRARGVNAHGAIWNIGINVPKEGAPKNEIQATVELKDWTISTSGNYRNFYDANGVKYSHTINPKTGFPERNTLLSASVFSENCITADAWATAFMVMGIDKAYEMATQLPEVEAYFIYGTPDGGMSVKYTSELASLFEKGRE
ncbi:MAG: FAD:protein FMN transferase [Saprospiraceae bacterium]|nr:FAD:protein FMN transferase [Saprospiraceae bacterium]